MSGLRQTAQEYLRIRRALGFKLETAGRLLLQFLDYLESVGAETITTEYALRWATLPGDANPIWWGVRLTAVRGFARYLQTIDPATELPPRAVLPVGTGRRRPTPYIYSEEEITALMTAAGHWRPWLSAFTLQTLIGLLTVTGIRIGEAIRLDRDDLALEHGRLVIRNSKFGKSRQLPLHQTTTRALHAYLRQRDELCPHVDTHALLITATGKRLDRSNVERQFRQLRTHGVDVFGSVLVTLALMLGVYAIVKSTDYDRASLHTFGFGGAAVALLGVFLAYGSRIANPVFPLPILRVPGLVGTQHRARVPGHRGCSRRSCSACCSAARARLRRAGDGPRVPADDADDGRAVARRRGAADEAGRTAGDAARRPSNVTGAGGRGRPDRPR